MSTRRSRLPREPTVALVIFGLGFLLLAAHQLTKTSPHRTPVSGARPLVFVTNLPYAGGIVCESAVTVPANTRSIEVFLGAYGRPGPALDLTVRTTSGALIARGHLAGGWVDGNVSVPLARPPNDPSTGDGRQLCIRFASGSRVAIAGELDGTGYLVRNGQAIPGRISLVAISKQQVSITSSAARFARVLGRGNAAFLGSWAAMLAAALLVGAVASAGLAVALTGSARGVHSRVPPAAKALVGASVCVGVCWAIVVPPFQVPDEISHVAYVQYLSETGNLPTERPGVPPFSPEERDVLAALGFSRVIGRPDEKVITSTDEESVLRRAERLGVDRRGDGNATTASANPPLYYLLQAPVYLATSKRGLLTAVLAMRLLSVLFTAGSVLFCFLFLRELLPRSPWSWTAGGLACALQPVLGFVGAGVNPDSLLFLCGSAMFFALALILQRGLTAPRAAGLGLAVAAGLLTKPLFFALVPVALVGLALAGWRMRSGWLRPIAAGLAVMFVPVLAWAVVGSAVLDHPYFAVATSVARGPGQAATSSSSLSKEASYIVQLFLPRPPFLTDQIPGVPIQDIWIKGLVGVFGWVDYGFSRSQTAFGTKAFVVLLLLSTVTVIRFRSAVLSAWPLAVCCVLGLAAIPAAIGITDYRAAVTGAARFEQARYLLPLLALYAGLFALASKALGSRAVMFFVPALWALVSLHTLAAVVLTINRYYL